jgi:2-dehydropantoate 2-reductase
MNIVILGVGVQGTVFGVRLAQKGHQVTLVARPIRAEELRQVGASIQNANNFEKTTISLPVVESLSPDCSADLCLVTVRREQLQSVLPRLAAATRISRFVFLVNHANGSADLVRPLGRQRVVLAFPGIAGSLDSGVVHYIEIPQQPTVVESNAVDVAAIVRDTGLPVNMVADMDAWLRRHAVFVTAIAGALYENGCDPRLLAQNSDAVRRFICGVREGWHALDRMHVAPAPFALRTILCWVPLRFSIGYWSKLLSSPRGDLYFARHANHAPSEMAALAADVRTFAGSTEAPVLNDLLNVIDRRAGSPSLKEQ